MAPGRQLVADETQSSIAADEWTGQIVESRGSASYAQICGCFCGCPGGMYSCQLQAVWAAVPGPCCPVPRHTHRQQAQLQHVFLLDLLGLPGICMR